MKFGETLYQRSVPKWSAYNVKYNELKHLIKQRTSAGAALPISIPSPSTSKWHDLETELYPVIRREHQDVSLFLRTKQGEIDRRLAHLEKQINAALRAVTNTDIDRPVSQARKYHKLVKEAEAIGDEIESLSRFAAVQKTAFRKILKKYRKWTGSTALQERLDRDVFSTGALQVDYAEYLQRLSKLTKIISNRLQAPMLTGQNGRTNGQRKRTLSQSNASTLNDLCARGPLHFDAALDNVQYGESGGSAYFWIHPDNLEQAEALLHRQMRSQHAEPPSRQSPRPSVVDLTQQLASSVQTHHAIFDNLQRLVRDESVLKPARAAIIARWDGGPEAVITLSSLAHYSDSSSTINIKRKHLASALGRDPSSSEPGSKTSQMAQKVKDYLSEHRDVKPLARMISSRKRFSGLNNTKDIGTWATLDTSVHVTSVSDSDLGVIHDSLDAQQCFPHAVLHVRWEFSRSPEVVRLLESSHVAERVHDFSLEEAAVHFTHPELEQPKWQNLLTTDIRRLPSFMPRRSGRRQNSSQDKGELVVANSSGPSSTGDSVFSATQGQSSATEVEGSPTSDSRDSPELSKTKPEPGPSRKPTTGKKPRVRVVAPPAEITPIRYWNEFDDGDSDVHVEERYAIYVDPDESSFPGAETFSKVFGSMYDSFRRGRDRVVSWLPMANAEQDSNGERSPLLFGGPGRKTSNDGAYDSSGDDTDHMDAFAHQKYKKTGRPSRLPYAPARKLSRRQRGVETTLFWFYTGLISLSYLLLILAGILLSTGRKKKRLEVDAGAVTGIVAAEAAAGIAVVLICMRRQQLGPIHWGLFAVNVAVVVTVGIGLMALVLGNSG
jgi:hypothetical protein